MSCSAEVSKLEEQVLEGYQNLVVLRNSLVQTDEERVRTEGMGTRVLDETERLKVELADADKETLSRREAIERLKADLKSLEEGKRRLEGASQRYRARPARACAASSAPGDRQYLTGLRVGGERILLLVDVSASMLDETVVNVLRMRNMSEARKLHVREMAAHAVDGRLARRADAGRRRVPDLCVQHARPGPLVRRHGGQVAQGRTIRTR